MLSGLENNFIINNKYAVRFAQSEEDVQSVQRLRFKVFNVELGEGLSSSYDQQLDVDKYDKQCHHLLVECKETGEVIGTYRMQTYDLAKQNNGFYTAEEFDLCSIPQDILNASTEVGRACIESSHRNGRVLFLLWRGLAKYLMHFKKKYLFGCCSLTSQSPREAWITMKYLEDHNHLHSDLQIPVKEEYACPEVKVGENDAAAVKLPQLFRLYLDLGAKVCSPPALDQSFKTIDFLVLLNIDQLDERSRMLFFK